MSKLIICEYDWFLIIFCLISPHHNNCNLSFHLGSLTATLNPSFIQSPKQYNILILFPHRSEQLGDYCSMEVLFLKQIIIKKTRSPTTFKVSLSNFSEINQWVQKLSERTKASQSTICLISPEHFLNHHHKIIMQLNVLQFQSTHIPHAKDTAEQVSFLTLITIS